MGELIGADSEHAAAKAARELSDLHAQTDEARASLARLKRDAAEAQRLIDSSQAAQLLEANEQLVLALLRAQAEIETASQVLDAVSRSAELDALTQLPNRTLLKDRCTQAIANAQRRHTRLALLFLDLDRFKQINDTLGHTTGDEVLKRTAHCLRGAVRKADTVSRYGGDEFVILLTEVSQTSDAFRIADKVLAALGAPSRVGNHVLCLEASIGISIYPDDGEDPDTLIARADAAMYHAKKHRMGSFAAQGVEFQSDPGSHEPARAAARPSSPATDPAVDEREVQHGHLREANERLVLAALGAQQLQAAAEEDYRRQTGFLARVAHELRNPLAPIRSAASTLGSIHSDKAILARVQRIIERQVEQMSRLISDLLDVARISTGKLRLDPRLVDLSALIDAAVDASRPSMEARLQQFSLHAAPGVLSVHGDAVRLTQVLVNLFDNASKYTPNGGRIDLSVTTVAGEAVVMTLTDTGIGITAETLPHIFDPFVQATQAVGFNGIGLGIGLTVVRELVEAHGGSIVAHSAGKGLGSRFVVKLLLAEAPLPSA